MATKTVINTNLPQTCGISILIDQEKQPQLRHHHHQHQPHHQQVGLGKQLAAESDVTKIIRIEQREWPENVEKLSSSRWPCGTNNHNKTLIDINQRDDHDDHDEIGEISERDDRGDRVGEEVVVATALPQSLRVSTSGKVYRVNGGKEGNTVIGGVGEAAHRHSANGSLASSARAGTGTGTGTTGLSVAHKDEVVEENGNSTGHKATVIQCNAVADHDRDDHDHDDDRDDDDDDEEQTKYKEESWCKTGKTGKTSQTLNGFSSGNSNSNSIGSSGNGNSHMDGSRNRFISICGNGKLYCSNSADQTCANDHHDHHDDDDHHRDNHNDDGDDEVGGVDGGVSGGLAFTRPSADGKRPLESIRRDSLPTRADCASAAQVTIAPSAAVGNVYASGRDHSAHDDKTAASVSATAATHVVKIQINPQNKVPTEKQVTVVRLNEQTQQPQQQQEQHSQDDRVIGARGAEDPSAPIVILSNGELRSRLAKMVQKPLNGAASGHSADALGAHHHHHQHHTTTGGSSVTELNVSHPTYLYYMMSSGQFSPCDTLDSGTGSDLESNGHQHQHQHQHHRHHHQQQALSSAPGHMANSVNGNGNGPKLEMHLKTTKILVSNAKDQHQRACSFTDSEESETSSLSCDSLHSSEFTHQSSSSPTNKTPSPATTILASYLPDSLLRDIRDRKFRPNDSGADDNDDDDPDADADADAGADADEEDNSPVNKKSPPEYRVAHVAPQYGPTQDASAKMSNTKSSGSCAPTKRASLPPKTFILNSEDGSFIDLKMNSMPRKYEADKYYNFHVREHENFRSFGNNCANGANGTNGLNGAEDGSLLCGNENDASGAQNEEEESDAFAGYKDIRCGSTTSTIRSSKGTIRGVKNRVRNGIATFLQLQQPTVKNYKEKDLGKVVLYTTSMGIIRDTYAKCSNVKQILRTLLVKFEERDVFMSVEYQQEIKERMQSDAIKVPQLFVEGQYIGDADTVERLNESGELRQLLKPYKSIATTYTCQTCGGYRLLPCPSCNGSKKSVHRNHFTAEFVALKCMNCDEVGLVKCHNC